MLTVTIITPEKALAPAQADHVTLPAFDGEVGIRTGHAAFVCLLGMGNLRVKSASRADAVYALRGGVAQVLDDQVSILAESVAEVGAISEQDLVRKIQEASAKTYEDGMELAQAKTQVNWMVTQLKAAGKQVPTEASKFLGG